MLSWKKVSNWEAAQHSTGGDLALDVERRLIQLQRAYKAGNVLALFEASAICDQQNIQLPAWISTAALDLLAIALKEGLSTKRGRAGPPLKRLQEDLKHFARWETVRSLIEHRDAEWRDYQELLQSPGLSHATRKKLRAQAPYNPGNNLQETFVAASEALVRSPAFGGPDAMEASYKLFKKASKAGAFTLLSYKTYQEFGLDPMTTISLKSKRKARVK
jgi:hypothetical protein